ETDIQKRTKNKAKINKTGHGMEKCEKTKPNRSQKSIKSNSQSQSQLREAEAENITCGTVIANSQSYKETKKRAEFVI
ncbi:hypothetical protein Tco_0041331, partial [Tanacetum coccineum]